MPLDTEVGLGPGDLLVGDPAPRKKEHSSAHFIMVALWNRADHYIFALWFLFLSSLWSPYGIGQTIIFSCCGLFFLLSFFLA